MYGNEEEIRRKISEFSPKSFQQKSILKKKRKLKSLRMGFSPEALEKKVKEIQSRQSIWAKNIRVRKKEKDQLFILSNEINKKKLNSSVPKTSQSSRKNLLKESMRKNEENNTGAWTNYIPKGEELIREKISPFVNNDIEIKCDDESKEDKKLSFEDDEIIKEIKFQKKLTKFIKTKIIETVFFIILAFLKSF